MLTEIQREYIINETRNIINMWGEGYKYFVEATPSETVLSVIGYFVHEQGKFEHMSYSKLFYQHRKSYVKDGMIICCCALLHDNEDISITCEKTTINNVTNDMRDVNDECFLWKIKCNYTKIIEVLDVISEVLCEKDF